MIRGVLLYIAFFLLIVLIVPCYLLALLAQTINLLPTLYLRLMKSTEAMIRENRNDSTRF